MSLCHSKGLCLRGVSASWTPSSRATVPAATLPRERGDRPVVLPTYAAATYAQTSSHSQRSRTVAAALPGASSPSSPAAGSIAPTQWVQKTITLPQHPRGCHVITRKVYEAVPELSSFEVGLANIFILHTSASLTINENASPEVPLDLNDALNRLAPEGPHYRHDDEGSDDMPAHIKSSLMGPSLTVPVAKGRFALGTWQGIYLNEHRNMGGPRSLVITIQGQTREDGRKYAAAWHS